MTVVLLHGVPLSARLYDGVQSRLAGPSLALTLPGFGGVPPLPGPPSLVGYADWVEARLPEGGASVLVGQDYGGLIAASLAARGLARGLVLISCPLSAAWWAAKVTAWPVLERPFYHWLGGARYVRRAVEPGRRAEFVRLHPTEDPSLPERMRDMARELSLGEICALPGLIRARGVRCAVLWGEGDRMFPPSAARATARALGVAVRWVPKARHGLPWDAPEAVVGAARAVDVHPSEGL